MSNVVPFISFEGTDGGGKSTQITLLKEWLQARDISPVMTREPGGCTTAEKIRELVLSPESDLGERGELLLYLAARAENVRQIIRPALEEDKWVITDRFCDSTFAYQGFGRGIDIEELFEVNRAATDGLMPTITFLLDIDVKIGKERVMKNRNELDRLEQSSLEFFENVRRGYLKLADREPERFVVLDATKTIEEVHAEIVAKIEPLLS